MIIEQKNSYTLITQKENNFSKFIESFNKKHVALQQENIVLQLLENINNVEKEILLLLKYSKMHKKNGTSFVVVCSNVDVDKFPETFNLVPTLIEAEDIIEFEEIERDLEF